MDIILFNVPMKNKADLKDLIEDVLTLQCFHIAAYREPSPILESFIASLSAEKREEKKKERKDSGSIFTPPYIAEYIVRGAVGPGIEKIKRDKRVKDKIKKILNYRICDPCVGGGIFLICAHDFLMNEILTIDPKANLEELSGLVAKRCLFGVDINPHAVEGTKLALQLNIAKWRLKKHIEEFASSATPDSSSLSDNSASPEKPSSAQEPAPAGTSTKETMRTSAKRKRAKRAARPSSSPTGTEPSASVPIDAHQPPDMAPQGGT
jgi:type I restriction-modification system DNA methylase subunit